MTPITLFYAKKSLTYNLKYTVFTLSTTTISARERKVGFLFRNTLLASQNTNCQLLSATGLDGWSYATESTYTAPKKNRTRNPLHGSC